MISTPATTRQRLVVQSSDPKIAACIMLAFKQGGVPLACKMVEAVGMREGLVSSRSIGRDWKLCPIVTVMVLATGTAIKLVSMSNASWN